MNQVHTATTVELIAWPAGHYIATLPQEAQEAEARAAALGHSATWEVGQASGHYFYTLNGAKLFSAAQLVADADPRIFYYNSQAGEWCLLTKHTRFNDARGNAIYPGADVSYELPAEAAQAVREMAAALAAVDADNLPVVAQSFTMNKPAAHTMKRNKLTRHEAKVQAIAAGINFDADYFTTGIGEKTTLSQLRKATGYRCNSAHGRSENYSFFLSLRDLKA